MEGVGYEDCDIILAQDRSLDNIASSRLDSSSSDSLTSFADSLDTSSFCSISGSDSGGALSHYENDGRGTEWVMLARRLLAELTKLSEYGVALSGGSCCYTLQYGGEVARAGNCLFDALATALGTSESGSQVRARCVAQCRTLMQKGVLDDSIQQRIANQYAPDINSGWGVECVQEHKLLIRLTDLQQSEDAIAERTSAGLDWTTAAGTVYEELGERVDDLDSWARYMALDGSEQDDSCVVTLQYVEDGLLSVEVCERQGAFGDDLAIEVLATEYQRDIYVVQAHGSCMDEEPMLFFLPHKPLVERQSAEQLPPLFLLMKGSDWKCSGADHYDPLIAQKRMLTEGSAPYITL